MSFRAPAVALVVVVSTAVHGPIAHAGPPSPSGDGAPLEALGSTPAARPATGTAALEMGVLVGPHHGDGWDVALPLGLTAVGLRPLSQRWSVGVGASILPLRGLFGLSIPARVEYTPVQDWRPFDAPGSLTLVLRAGVRSELVRPLSLCAEPHEPGHCARGSGFGALGELGFALRGAAGQLDGAQPHQRFELGVSLLGGPMQGWGSGATAAPRALYVGGTMTLGVAF